MKYLAYDLRKFKMSDGFSDGFSDVSSRLARSTSCESDELLRSSGTCSTAPKKDQKLLPQRLTQTIDIDTCCSHNKRLDKEETRMPKTDKNKGMGIMDAVSALTTLGDEESGSEGGEKPSPEKKGSYEQEKRGSDEDENGDSKPRYIPEHKKPDAALTFPEKVRDCHVGLNVILFST